MSDSHSNGKHWCKYCKIFIQNNHVSIKNHEEGWNHKKNATKFVETQNREKKYQERERLQTEREIKRIQAAGERVYIKKDLGGGGDSGGGGAAGDDSSFANSKPKTKKQELPLGIPPPPLPFMIPKLKPSVGEKRKADDLLQDIESFKDLSEQDKLYVQKRILEAQANRENEEDEDEEDEEDEEEEDEDEEGENEKESVVGGWEYVNPSESMFGTSKNSDDEEEEEKEEEEEEEEEEDSDEETLRFNNKRIKVEKKSKKGSDGEDEPVIIVKKPQQNNKQRNIRKVVSTNDS